MKLNLQRAVVTLIPAKSGSKKSLRNSAMQLHEYTREDLEKAFQDNNLDIAHVAEGEAINSDHSKYNFLYLLKKV